MKTNVSQENLLVAAPIITGLLAKYAPKVIEGLKKKTGGETGERVFSAARDMLAGEKSTDLVRFTQSARVEPILLMDKRCANIPFIQDVVHSLFNRFTSYWLLAISLDTKINGVTVGRRLDKFSTDRELNNMTTQMFANASMESVSMEAFGLPFIKEIVASQESEGHTMAEVSAAAAILAEFETGERPELERIVKDMEHGYKQIDAAATAKARREAIAKVEKIQADLNEKLRIEKLDRKYAEAIEKIKSQPSKMGAKDVAKYVEKISNLAVGNVIDVTISEDGKEAVVPVNIRLRVAGAPSDVMAEIMAVGGKDATFMSRFRAWRAGEIKFWSDFVLAMDRVDAHRAAMMKDESGYYKAVHARNSNNTLAKIVNDGPSIATASSILVLDTKTAKELERKINGTLDQYAMRQAIFGQTFSMLMAVVDPDWESVTIYTRGIEMADRLTLKDLKFASKGDNKELMDMLKGMQLGQAPGGSRF